MIHVEKLQIDIYTWFNKNFAKNQTKEYLTKCQIIGMIEELGELSHAILKIDQGIRKDENHEEQIIDAVADIMIFGLNFLSLNDLNIAKDIKEGTYPDSGSSFECIFNINIAIANLSLFDEMDQREIYINSFEAIFDNLVYILQLYFSEGLNIYHIIDNVFHNKVQKRDWTDENN